MRGIGCPKGHGRMEWRTIRKTTTFKGVDIVLDVHAHVCPKCGLEAGTLQSAGAVQRAIADAYRENMDLCGNRDALK